MGCLGPVPVATSGTPWAPGCGRAPRPRRQEAGLAGAVPAAESAASLQEPTQVEDHW